MSEADEITRRLRGGSFTTRGGIIVPRVCVRSPEEAAGLARQTRERLATLPDPAPWSRELEEAAAAVIDGLREERERGEVPDLIAIARRLADDTAGLRD